MLQTTVLTTGLDEGFWDDLTLTTPNEVIKITDRNEGLELDRVLTIADYNGHTGDITVDIHQQTYKWNDKTWREVHSVISQWSREYLIVESEFLENLNG